VQETLVPPSHSYGGFLFLISFCFAPGWPGGMARGIDPLRQHTSDHIPRSKVERSGDSHKVGQARRVSERVSE